MGLLSFRKKSSDDDDQKKSAEETSTDVIGSNLSNEAWLAGVERRAEDAQPTAAAPEQPQYSEEAGLPDGDGPESAITEQYEAAAEQMAEVQSPTVQDSPVVTHAAPTLQGGAGADMGIVYAGLESQGVATFPSEAPEPDPAPAAEAHQAAPFAEQSPMQAAPFAEQPMQAAPIHEPAPTSWTPDPSPAAPVAEPAPTLQAPPSPHLTIENGPIGPEAGDFLRTLGLSPGCSWDDVSSTRRAILSALPTTGAPEEQQARAEVNHAYASLRLLRVGPLRG